jgi:hypothetical protein
VVVRGGVEPPTFRFVRRLRQSRHVQGSTPELVFGRIPEWAGHSVDVLLRIYAKCVVGQDELAKRRISEALRQG